MFTRDYLYTHILNTAMPWGSTTLSWRATGRGRVLAGWAANSYATDTPAQTWTMPTRADLTVAGDQVVCGILTGDGPADFTVSSADGTYVQAGPPTATGGPAPNVLLYVFVLPTPLAGTAAPLTIKASRSVAPFSVLWNVRGAGEYLGMRQASGPSGTVLPASAAVTPGNTVVLDLTSTSGDTGIGFAPGFGWFGSTWNPANNKRVACSTAILPAHSPHGRMTVSVPAATDYPLVQSEVMPAAPTEQVALLADVRNTSLQTQRFFLQLLNQDASLWANSSQVAIAPGERVILGLGWNAPDGATGVRGRVLCAGPAGDGHVPAGTTFEVLSANVRINWRIGNPLSTAFPDGTGPWTAGQGGVLGWQAEPRPLVITPLAVGVAGREYRAALLAHGGRPPYAWQVTGLPDRLYRGGPFLTLTAPAAPWFPSALSGTVPVAAGDKVTWTVTIRNPEAFGQYSEIQVRTTNGLSDTGRPVELIGAGQTVTWTLGPVTMAAGVALVEGWVTNWAPGGATPPGARLDVLVGSLTVNGVERNANSHFNTGTAPWWGAQGGLISWGGGPAASDMIRGVPAQPGNASPLLAVTESATWRHIASSAGWGGYPPAMPWAMAALAFAAGDTTATAAARFRWGVGGEHSAELPLTAVQQSGELPAGSTGVINVFSRGNLGTVSARDPAGNLWRQVSAVDRAGVSQRVLITEDARFVGADDPITLMFDPPLGANFASAAVRALTDWGEYLGAAGAATGNGSPFAASVRLGAQTVRVLSVCTSDLTGATAGGHQGVPGGYVWLNEDSWDNLFSVVATGQPGGTDRLPGWTLAEARALPVFAQPEADPIGTGRRGYDLTFDRRYEPVPVPPTPEPEPEPEPEPAPELPVPILWNGTNISPGHLGTVGGADWFTAIVTNVTGWYASPTVDGHDTARALADGGAYGPKVLQPREITITGAAVGPRRQLIDWRNLLVQQASSRVPAALEITDPWLRKTLVALVRVGTGQLDHEFFAGPQAFRYGVTVTAADPLLYDREWQEVTLTNTTAEETGRPYPRVYTHPRAQHPNPLNGWVYESPYPPGSAAYLTNEGNAAAPVVALYTGDLSASRLTDEDVSILLAALPAQVEILVPTATLAAEASGGEARAAFVLPGSRPLLLPPQSTTRWHLYAEGSGSVRLAWRSAWT